MVVEKSETCEGWKKGKRRMERGRAKTGGKRLGWEDKGKIKLTEGLLWLSSNEANRSSGGLEDVCSAAF